MNERPDHFSWLTTVSPSDGNFKSHLDDAPIEVLNDALDFAGEHQHKTRFKAITGEIKKRLEESGSSMHELPAFESYPERAKDEAAKAKILEDLKVRARNGDHAAVSYCMQERIEFRETPSPSPADEKTLILKNGSTAIFAASEVALHNLFHRNAMLATAQGACWIVLAGVELTRQKKTLKHGEWKSWVEEHCEYSYETAVRYMGLADGVKSRALRDATKGDLEQFLALLNTPTQELTAEQQRQLLESVYKLTDGQTVQQLYLDFGITKALARKGGARVAGDKDDSKSPQKPAGWTDEAWARYLGLAPEMRHAVDEWRPRLDWLHDQVGEGTCIHHLPKAERDELRAIHRQLGTLLAALGKNTKGVK